MRATDSRIVCSATDLSHYLACPHLTSLKRGVALGELPRPRTFDDPGADAIQRRGLEHEARVLERFRADGGTVEEIADSSPDLDYEDRWREAAERTAEAMRGGVDVIYQGRLYDGSWGGYPDFLLRVEAPSNLGPWSYEVVDAKLTREAKGGAMLQIALYSDLLAAVQGRAPERMHLALGRRPDEIERDGGLESFRFDEYSAYYRAARRRFEAHVGSPPDTYPEPVEHCRLCDWRLECEARRRADDHLCLVAGITRNQRRHLVGRDVDTLAVLGALDLPPEPRIEGIGDVPLVRIREQARIQAEGRATGRNLHEVLTPVEEERGLALIPAPSPGDLFFDIEGDAYALEEGVEYLFGFVDASGSYEGWWGLDRAEEKTLFQRFIDFAMERWDRYPDFHIYHYAPYETTALKKLMGRHATREDQVDRLLRGGVLVDLYRSVRQGVRASVESYSIKKMEPFYGFEREVDLREATGALVQFQAGLQLGLDRDEAGEMLDVIERYNRDDCVSTLRLRDWLETCRQELEAQTGAAVPRPARKDPDPSEKSEELRGRLGELFAALTADLPPVQDDRAPDPADRTPEQQARWILAQLLDFHWREDKSTWWEYYHRRDFTDEELLEDRSTLGGLTYEGELDYIRRSTVHRYRFPVQEHDIKEGGYPRDPATGERCGKVMAVDDAAGTIDLMRGNNSTVPHPAALIPLVDIRFQVLRDSLLRLGDHIVADGFSEESPRRAALDLLLRTPPRLGQAAGAPILAEGEESLKRARRLAVGLERTVLPIQGPPGSGKTYTGARMIVSLLADGKRVGITAHSHKVITNLLKAVCKAADKEGVEVRGVQKPNERDGCTDERIEQCPGSPGNAKVRAALASGEATLAGGTAWLWSREDMAGSVDVLFVDEAGQMSLANTLAVSQAADSLVLLGDPRQLDQPTQGAHPPGTDVSPLGHLLGDRLTIAPEQGIFLSKTWRMHPDVCAFTSEQFYQGRLTAKSHLAAQEVRGPDWRAGGALGPLEGRGLRFIPVEHEGNQNASEEEAGRIGSLVCELLAAEPTWVNEDGDEVRLRRRDILIVAPYNAQVAAVAAHVPEGMPVGTVDKFQGQEAPIVIYSMATSTPDDAPRGMEFLYSLNRLNVATSRARCVAALVANPALLSPECRSPRQMRLANAFCRLLEMARTGA